MNNSSKSDISIDEIIQKVNEEVNGKITKNEEKLTVEFTEKKIEYTIDEFLYLDGELFIENAYRIILNREADIDGKNNYLSKLENNTTTKKEIILTLLFSKEGKNSNINIKNAKRLYIFAKLNKIPFIGYSLKTIFMIARLPKLIGNLEHNEQLLNETLKNKAFNSDLENMKSQLRNEIDLSKYESKENMNLSIEEIESKIEVLKSVLDEKLKESTEEIEKSNKLNKEIKNNLVSINNSKESISTVEKNMKDLISQAKERLPSSEFKDTELLDIVNQNNTIFDSFYVSFEDEFRGTRESVKKKVKIYLPYINNISRIKEDVNLIDLGCGRGEWLELLKENGYSNIKGIDLNSVMISHSKKIDLDVEHIDAVKYLKSLPDNSLSVVSGFHIIEHLPFEVLMNVFKESYRVLKNGGMIIFETPNPRNILVGSSDFYLDPTHINPIHPMTLKFIATQSGFTNAKSMILNDDGLTDFDTINFNDINDFINIGRDLSVIAYK